jgi:hypothetical protein
MNKCCFTWIREVCTLIEARIGLGKAARSVAFGLVHNLVMSKAGWSFHQPTDMVGYDL